MTRHSSVEIDSSEPTASELPLSDRPLVVVDQNTVISSDNDSVVPLPETPLTATAQEIRDRLFSGSGGDSAAGLRIGPLEVETKIGSGGMGAVFRAVDLELARKVALKVLHPSIAADPALVARFRNEARACAQLCHDNIARVFYAGEQDGVYYIAYEYADGLTLKELIEQNVVLTPGETVNYAIQTTLALNHIDAAGIVHRDIKPSNIILTTNGRIKVVDLGLARRETNDSIGDLTVAGTTLGTFDYIAPEQARDPRVADIRSDIYSLGCTVYHMLTGQPPYPEGTALQKLLDHQGKSPPDPRLISKGVPAELTTVVQKMMNTDPEKRYQDPGQLLADLMTLATGMGLRSIPADGIVWRRIPVTKVRGLSGSLFVTGAVIALCLSALAMHFLPSVNRPAPEVADVGDYLLKLFAPAERDETPVRPSATTSDNATADAASADSATAVTGSMPANAQGTVGPVSPASGTQTPPADNSTVSSVTDTDSVAGSDVAVVIDERTPGSNITTSPITGAAVTNPFVVRHLDGSEDTEPTTLDAAWANARNGDVIELHFDGPLGVPTYRMGPLQSQESQHITIQAARGRSPVIVFSGDQRTIRSEDPGQLFDLGNNLKLSLKGIHFQVRVVEDVQDDQWVMFECNGANRVEMRNCTISVQNPVKRDIAVFRLNDPGAGSFDDVRTGIDMHNCVVRGACDLVLVTDQAGGQVSTQDCAFALDGSLVRSLGSSELVPQGDLVVSMDHCTSILGRPAFRMQDSKFRDGSEPERFLPRLEVNSTACVYSTVSPTDALVEILGNAYREDLQDHLIWKGTDNLYHNYNGFWYIESGSLDGDIRNYYFTEWVSNWTRMTAAREASADIMNDTVWRNRDPSLTRADLSNVSLESFELDQRFFYMTENEPPRYRPDDQGRIAGVDVSLLPTLPFVDIGSERVMQPEPDVTAAADNSAAERTTAPESPGAADAR
ncbi:MAG: serine/threonine-protein kinase [Planctomycetaceae bacterium]